VTAYAWNGVPVYSVNTPLREGNDWIYADPEIRPAFESVLDRFKPDLVHFHAIQRLTTVMIDAVQARSIPFVVTVHDAWWISDHQFLIDSRDRLELPWERPASGAGNAPAGSAVRLAVLASRLAQAKAVLAVSESFAALYRRAGIPNVKALVNGMAELPPIENGPRPEKKLRIGHFGGMGYIKGLFLLKRALSRGQFPDLELVTVDLAKTYGEESHEMWGATPVRIIGRVPQDNIGWLYGQIDVLIAPSVWPESFGLCVREAVTYGNWFVVSDRGALPEAVLPDVNGFVIDLNDPQALPEMLKKLQGEMPRFLQPPAAAPHIATMRENTAALCGIFNEILAAPQAAKPKERPQPSARRRNEVPAELAL
jgi:glycosyltransferase involved in cell wall biosynthesis